MAERLVVENLVKVYTTGNRALDDVSFEIDPGTFLVLLGPSGSGKTTLLRAIAGIEHISAGKMSIGDVVVADNKSHLAPERRDLSMVFQDYALWPHMTARDNVAFALKRRGHSRPEARRRASAMLERVGLQDLALRYPTELSGGEQQRVALARALIGDTGLILFDEPLSNLDADLRERMRVEISSLVRGAGATSIYITHDQSEAFALADEVGVLEHGRLVQFGSPEQIYAHPATQFVARFTGLAGELPVTVCSDPDADGCVEIEPLMVTGGQRARARLVGVQHRSRTGLLMIRPTAIRVCSGDDDEHHLVGRVADVAFRGRGYEHAVTLAHGSQITSVFSDVRFERGRVIGLRLDAAGCLLFPGSDDREMAAQLESVG